MGQVAAAGTSTTARNYAFLDKDFARYGTLLVYYHLNQVDRDGQRAFWPVRTLVPDALTWDVSAYPSPFAVALSATLSTSEAGPVTLTMYDVTGRVVLQRQLIARVGTQVVDLPEAHTVVTGEYVLRVQQGIHAGTVRITKK